MLWISLLVISSLVAYPQSVGCLKEQNIRYFFSVQKIRLKKNHIRITKFNTFCTDVDFWSSGIPGDDDSKRPSRAQQQSLNAECILSKEQLYDMFQQILGVKKFEHQLLFNALLVSLKKWLNGMSWLNGMD